jgi:hypothetical protein
MPIVDEVLHVIGMDRHGDVQSKRWRIKRVPDASKPELEEITGSDQLSDDAWVSNFLMPAKKAFSRGVIDQPPN